MHVNKRCMSIRTTHVLMLKKTQMGWRQAAYCYEPFRLLSKGLNLLLQCSLCRLTKGFNHAQLMIEYLLEDPKTTWGAADSPFCFTYGAIEGAILVESNSEKLQACTVNAQTPSASGSMG